VYVLGVSIVLDKCCIFYLDVTKIHLDVAYVAII
jgi:hypothetical protein